MWRGISKIMRTSVIHGHVCGNRNVQAVHTASKHLQKTKAVIFDMGGVIIPSPGEMFGGQLCCVLFLCMLIVMTDKFLERSYKNIHYGASLCICISEYEHKHGLPENTIVKTIIKTGNSGAWARLETGAITAVEFGKEFSQECSSEVNRSYNHFSPKIEKIYCSVQYDIGFGRGLLAYVESVD